MYPVLFKIGGFKVHSFGVMLIIAFFSGLWLALKRAGRYGFQRSEVFDFAFWTLLWGVLGARIVFILQEWSVYRSRPSDLFTLQFQGLTSFGGILFGLGYLAYYCIRRRKSLLDVLDLLCLPMLLGHAIGRIGCLLNGCCFGDVCPADLPWAIQLGGQPHHPAQVYDSLMNIAALLFLLWIERRGMSPGRMFSLFLVFHGLSRFVYEFWRAGTVEQVRAGLASSTYIPGTLVTEAQAVAASMVGLGIVLYFVFGRKGYINQEIRIAEAS